ncbi:MAG: hypothetical protein E7K63_18495, partial [Acinetobacter baumannii]|nr:hypothetical protein [Acinetobacter baumannii]
EGVVGCWYQHNQGRVSLSNGQLNKSVEIPVWVFDRILKLYFTLYENNRLTLSRKRKISTALWNFISNYYYKNPVICHELVNKIYENGLDSYNEMGVRLQKNYFFKLCIHRYPLLYIKVKDFFMKVFPSRGIESFVRKL